MKIRLVFLATALAICALGQYVFVGYNSGSGAVACTATVTADAGIGVGTQNNSLGTNLSDTAAGPATADANTMLVAAIMFDGTGSSVGGCTWASATMTAAGTAAHNASQNINAALYYIMNPATGTNTLACTGTSVTEYYWGLMAFHNVSATTPVRSGSYTASTNGTLSIPSNSQDVVIADAEGNGNTPAFTGATASATSGAGNNGSIQGYKTTPSNPQSITFTVPGAGAAFSAHCK